MTRDDPHFRLRLPAELKARIEAEAQRQGRSINAEIVQALEQYFPPEPTIDELLDRIQHYVNNSKHPDAPAYRKNLVDALDRLQQRLEAGVEFDQPKSKVWSVEKARDHATGVRQGNLRSEWQRQNERGKGIAVDQLRAFLADGLLVWIGEARFRRAYEHLQKGEFRETLRALALGTLQFEDEAAAVQVFREELERIRKEAGI